MKYIVIKTITVTTTEAYDTVLDVIDPLTWISDKTPVGTDFNRKVDFKVIQKVIQKE